MNKLVEPLLVKELKSLPTFEEKCVHWKANFNYSFFQPLIISKDEVFRLTDEISDLEDKVTLVRHEIERAIRLDSSIWLTEFQEDAFVKLERSKKTETTKKAIISTLMGVQSNWNSFKKEGFDCYNGLDDIYDMAKAFCEKRDDPFSDINGIIPTTFHERLKEYVRGYRIAVLVNEVSNYETHFEKTIEERDNRIEVNLVSEKFAALIYILAEKGVLNLAYLDFNQNYYNGEETAKLCQKHFKVISQKGPTQGQEVSIETLNKAFKKSVIDATLGNRHDKLFDALQSLPKNHKNY